MKKFLCTLLAVLMIISTLGVAAIAEEKTELTMWIWDANQLPGSQAMAEAFMEKNPNVSIEVSYITDYTTKLPTVLGTDDCPDIMWLWGTATVDFINNGMLTDLTPYIDRDNYDTTPWVQGITEWYTRDGHLYAIPKDFDGYGVYYSKSLFDAAGVAYPENDWTWEDFRNTAQAISDALADEGVYGFAGAGDHRVVSATSLSFGGQYYDETGLKCTINDENTIKAWDFLKGMMDSGASASNTDLIELGTGTMFSSNIAAMCIDGSWCIKSYYEALGDDMGFAEMPTGEAGKVVTTHGIGYAMSKNCKYPEEAWQFISYLGTEEAQLLLADVVIPAHLEAAEQWASYYEADVSPVVAGLNYAVMYPMSVKNATEANSIESKYINSLFAGEFANATECLNACQAEMQAAIDG